MKTLNGYQRKYLRGLAHTRKPVVLIGQQGLTETVVAATEASLRRHELIKVHFNEFKEKPLKQSMGAELADRTRAHLVGLIGHTAILYRPHPDPQRRTIRLPGPSEKS